MKKNLLAFCFSALAAGAISAQAQMASDTPPATSAAPAPAAAAPAAPAAPTPPSWSTVLTGTYVSQYMFRGSRLGGNSLQPSVTSTYGPWSFGVWCSDPLTNSDKVEGQSDPEIDPSASYTFTINDTTNLQPGFTWYTYLRAPTDQGFYRETFEPNLALNYTVVGVTLTPKVYYDVVLQGPTYEMNAAYTVPLKDLGTEIDLVGSAGTFLQTDVANQASPKVKAWGNYWLIGFTCPFTITKNSKLILGWSLTEGNSSYTKQGSAPKVLNPEAVSRGFVTASYAWTF